MSIRPIDYNVILPKTQEVSASKHIENLKHRNIVESGFTEQNKQVEIKQSKVLDSEKTNKKGIRDEENSQRRNGYNSRRKKKEKKDDKKKKNILLGDKIDIHI